MGEEHPPLNLPMPELPEVETVVRALRAAATGARIEGIVHASRRVALGNRPGWRRQIVARTIAAVSRRGKYIIIRMTGGCHLVIHLRMTGHLRLRSNRIGRGPHDRLILTLRGPGSRRSRQLVLVDTRQFARADYCPPGGLLQHQGLSRLGPEATDIGDEELHGIAARSRRSIKALLLDQHVMAGLGNIYADEALFAAGIHPAALCHRLGRTRLIRLRTEMERILAAAIAACGTTFDTFSDLTGQAGGFAPKLMVYGRTGEPCRVCGHSIKRMVIVGRGTHYCPGCQRR
ncbi:MAG: bifunctional DNA-formamidopyrimidine glycosylase/DNA-(apurinic or apyrimidinic site) lyase [Candidatus Zixiibacteriota bacterium]